MSSSQNPTRIGRYEITKRLGAGGMGVLYLAHDPLLERDVAIKVLSHLSPELRVRFSREARAAARLKHPNVVILYDVGEEAGQPFIAMEYVEGETLGDIIRRRAPLDIWRKAQLMVELCDGLSYAHRMGVVHRDVKPSNLMLNADGVLKILDFGLARASSEMTSTELTMPGTMMGTPHYMSPEQIEGLPVDARSDIFSVGLVCYELLAYRKAYPGDSAPIVLHKILTSDPPALREHLPQIDRELERVIHTAIRRVPDQRYGTLAAMLEDLGRVIAQMQAPGSSDQSTIIHAGPSTPDTLAQRASPPPTAMAPAPAAHQATANPTPLPAVPAPVPTAAPGSETTPKPGDTPATPRYGAGLDAIARRRAAQIDEHLVEAARALDAHRFEAAIEQCERAAALDPQHPGMLALLDRAHEGAADSRVQAWLTEAEDHLSRGALTQAELLLEQVRQMRPALDRARELESGIARRRQDLERSRQLKSAIVRARGALADRSFDAAVQAARDARAIDPGSAEAGEIERAALAGLEEQRVRQRRERDADSVIDEARRWAADGDLAAAVHLLESFVPPHPRVSETLTEFRATLVRTSRELEMSRLAETMLPAAAPDPPTTPLSPPTATALDRTAGAGPELERRSRPAPADAPRPVHTPLPVAAQPRGEAQHATPAARTGAADLTPTPGPGSGPSPVGIRAWLVAAAAVLVVALVAGVWLWPGADAPSPGTDNGAATRQDAAVAAVDSPTDGTTPTGGRPTAGDAPTQSLLVNAVPWATVRIQPAAAGAETIERTTPFAVSLPAGEYRMEFRHPQFQPVTRSITVGAGAPAPVTVALPGADVDRIVADVLGAP